MDQHGVGGGIALLFLFGAGCIWLCGWVAARVLRVELNVMHTIILGIIGLAMGNYLPIFFGSSIATLISIALGQFIGIGGFLGIPIAGILGSMVVLFCYQWFAGRV
ncbi:MAG: hypothetical protein K8F25_09365 [Fimbriimonadaceae bacterium]|nr:hypothetical protein [Alphaproteobacteria bacterium]